MGRDSGSEWIGATPTWMDGWMDGSDGWVRRVTNNPRTVRRSSSFRRRPTTLYVVVHPSFVRSYRSYRSFVTRGRGIVYVQTES